MWATLLALEVGGELTVGAVSAPGARAALVGGAGERRARPQRDPTARTRELACPGVQALGDAQLCFGGLEEWEQVGRVDALLELGRACWRTRGFGDFWGYMLVAEGGAEIMLDPIVSVWDLAAPFVIVEEAGGRFTDLAGRAHRRRRRARDQRPPARGGARDRRAVMAGPAVRHRRSQERGRHARSRSAGAPLATRTAPGDARRVRRPGAAAGAWLGAAPRVRGGATALDDPARPAGKRQDHARAAAGVDAPTPRSRRRARSRPAAPRCAR